MNKPDTGTTRPVPIEAMKTFGEALARFGHQRAVDRKPMTTPLRRPYDARDKMLAGCLEFWGYVLGPRTNSQRDKYWRWDFCWNSGPVDWLMWKCPWLTLLLERYEVSRWEIILCRHQGHKCGAIYYNPGALEPDMHCKDCNEDIG